MPIPGTKRHEYLEENAGVADIELTNNGLSRIEEVAPASATTRYADRQPIIQQGCRWAVVRGLVAAKAIKYRGMRIPDRTGVIVGYRVWRVIPSKWVDPSQSLSGQYWFRSWSLTEATVARCPQRFQGDPGRTLGRSRPCEDAPSFGCTCGLYARYEPIQETHHLPYIVGSMLAWGRVVHHADRSFFRAEKALPIAFVRPRKGGGAFPHLAKDKFFRIADLLGAEVVEGSEELRVYSEMEASKW